MVLGSWQNFSETGQVRMQRGGYFFNTVNHSFDQKNHGAHPFFPLENHGADNFFSAWETTEQRLLRQDDGEYTFLRTKIYTGHVNYLTDIPSFLFC